MLLRSQVRELDRQAIEQYGIPGVVLMENAGRGVAEVLLTQRITGPVHIVCGKGNNAGDGYVIARHLDAQGIGVVVHQCAPDQELSGDAAINYRILKCAQLTVLPVTTMDVLGQRLQEAQWIIDALLGTGLTGIVREPFYGVIRTMNASDKPILAVDLPSGMDADSGQPLGVCVVAQQTVTFVAPKQGFSNPESHQYTGQVHVASIGVPRTLLHEYGVSS